MTLSFLPYYIVIACFAVPLHAQAGRAELFGTVHDTSGLTLASASAELHEGHTGLSYQTVTTPEGVYHFFALPPGDYTLVVHKPGFLSLRRAGITLDVGSRTAL